jgi:hypothetical protein
MRQINSKLGAQFAAAANRTVSGKTDCEGKADPRIAVRDQRNERLQLRRGSVAAATPMFDL